VCSERVNQLTVGATRSGRRPSSVCATPSGAAMPSSGEVRMILQTTSKARTEDDMTTDKKVARRKLSLLELASDLGNVRKACRVIGYSRQHFYEIRRNFQTYSAEGLLDRLPRRQGAAPELFLQLEDEHKRTRVNRPQSNGIMSAGIVPCSTSISASKAAAPGSRPSRRCRPSSISTSSNTIPNDRTRAVA